jgi:hypothetical protein
MKVKHIFSYNYVPFSINGKVVVAVIKQRLHRFCMERFNPNKLNEVEGKEQYRVGVSNRFTPMEDMDAEVVRNSAWETIRENIKISPNCGGTDLSRR